VPQSALDASAEAIRSLFIGFSSFKSGATRDWGAGHTGIREGKAATRDKVASRAQALQHLFAHRQNCVI
jgi:hypothetical protein